MSYPRQVLPGTTYLVSRRCSQRQFLTRPSKKINNALLFCLSEASRKYGVLIHASIVMGNHFHVVATDPEGQLPRFMHWFCEFSAKCINSLYDRWESVWCPGSYSAVVLVDQEAVLKELVYTLTNPVKAGLVMYGHQWPGLRHGPADLGRPLTSRRPYFFFRKNGPLPEFSTLVLSKPPAFSEVSDDDYAQLVMCEVERKEAEYREQARLEGRRYWGRRAVLAQSPSGAPRTQAPRRRLNPRVAGADKKRRTEAIEQIKAFVQSYRVALSKFKEGLRDVLFPAGTYWMRVHQGVACAAPG